MVVEVMVHTREMGNNFIDCSVTSAHGGNEFSITWVYGDPDFALRRQNWVELRRIGATLFAPWLCLGDFNDIANHGEKLGGRRKYQRKIDEFNDLLADLHLEDIGFKGQTFTWSNNRR